MLGQPRHGPVRQGPRSDVQARAFRLRSPSRPGLALHRGPGRPFATYDHLLSSMRKGIIRSPLPVGRCGWGLFHGGCNTRAAVAAFDNFAFSTFHWPLMTFEQPPHSDTPRRAALVTGATSVLVLAITTVALGCWLRSLRGVDSRTRKSPVHDEVRVDRSVVHEACIKYPHRSLTLG